MAIRVVGFNRASRVYEIEGGDPTDADVLRYPPGSRLLRRSTGGQWTVLPTALGNVVVPAYNPAGPIAGTTGFHNLQMEWFYFGLVAGVTNGTRGAPGMTSLRVLNSGQLFSLGAELTDPGTGLPAPAVGASILFQWSLNDVGIFPAADLTIPIGAAFGQVSFPALALAPGDRLTMKATAGVGFAGVPNASAGGILTQ